MGQLQGAVWSISHIMDMKRNGFYLLDVALGWLGIGVNLGGLFQPQWFWDSGISTTSSCGDPIQLGVGFYSQVTSKTGGNSLKSPQGRFSWI